MKERCWREERNYTNIRVSAIFHSKHFQMLARKGRHFARLCANWNLPLTFILFPQGKSRWDSNWFLPRETITHDSHCSYTSLVRQKKVSISFRFFWIIKKAFPDVLIIKFQNCMIYHIFLLFSNQLIERLFIMEFN